MELSFVRRLRVSAKCQESFWIQNFVSSYVGLFWLNMEVCKIGEALFSIDDKVCKIRRGLRGLLITEDGFLWHVRLSPEVPIRLLEDRAQNKKHNSFYAKEMQGLVLEVLDYHSRTSSAKNLSLIEKRANEMPCL